MRGFLRGIKPRSLGELKLIMEQDKLNVAKEKLKVDVEVAQIGARATKYAANVRAAGVVGAGLLFAYTAYQYFKPTRNTNELEQKIMKERRKLDWAEKYSFLF
ncbi:MAG: hypothetical protein ABSA84_04600 [Gammaproteobacteria bacterium]|jgi:hypothetical protein